MTTGFPPMPDLVVGKVDPLPSQEVLDHLLKEFYRELADVLDNWYINEFPRTATTVEWCAFHGIPLPKRHHPKTRFR